MNLGNLKTTFNNLSEPDKLDLIIRLRADRRISKVVVKAKRKSAGSIGGKQSILKLAKDIGKDELAILINKLEKEMKGSINEKD